MKKLGVDNPKQWLDELNVNAQDRVSWRAAVKGFEISQPRTAVLQSTRPYLGRASKRRVA